MAKAPRYEGLTPETTPAEAARAILRPLLAAALSESPAVLREQDVRATHDMRVALRRLRSALDTFADEFPADEVRFHARALRRLARRLGEVRDADVHLAELRSALGGATAPESAGIAHAIEATIARRRAALARFAIELSQFDRDALAATIAAPHDGSHPQRLRTFARHTLRKRSSAVRRAARAAFPSGRDDDLHALRKKVKRLRYALEFFAALLGPAGAEAVEELTRAQDRLGTIADAAAFRHAYETLLAPLDAADPRRVGLAACCKAARARRKKALAAARALWTADDGQPGKLAASISSALGSLSPKSAANGPAGTTSNTGR
jgi:CHAD domain-containing protein